MKTLVLKTETVRVLQSADLDQVVGGAGSLSSIYDWAKQKVSSMFHPTSTAQPHPPVSSIRPTATAVSSAREPQQQDHRLSSVRPGGE